MTIDSNPLVSIIIANYNSKKFILDTLKSLANQSYNNLEPIIIDDCSTDESPQIIEKFIKEFLPSGKFIKNYENLGGGNTKLKGLNLASGQIQAFLDCDDFLEKDAIMKMVEMHKLLPECGLIYSNAYLVDTNGNIKGLLNKASKIPEGFTILDNGTAFHLATWKKDHYDRCKTGFDEKFNVAYDLDLYYKLEEVTKTHYVDEPLYYYREHDSNLSLGFNRLGLSLTELIIAKYEAQLRRNQLNLNNLGNGMQLSFINVRRNAINSVGFFSVSKKLIRYFLLKILKFLKIK